jgi:hypothetical protein
MYLPIIRDPNFLRVVSRAKKVAEACTANALSIDHLRVAALLARRDKTLKPSSGWQPDWVGLAEASAKVELPSVFRLPTHRHYAANFFSC